MRHGCRWGLSLLVLTAIGCGAITFEHLAPPDDLPPAVLDQPQMKVAPESQTIADVEVQQVSRGTRGGYIRLSYTNRQSEPIALDWTKLKITLSSGESRNVLDGVQLEKLCAEFTLQAYGIASADFTLPEGWALPTAETPVLKMKPGETVNLVLPFGAMPEIDWLTIDFTPALAKAQARSQRSPARPSHLMVAVQLPDVLPPPQKPSWWPEWLQLGFVATSG